MEVAGCGEHDAVAGADVCTRGSVEQGWTLGLLLQLPPPPASRYHYYPAPASLLVPSGASTVGPCDRFPSCGRIKQFDKQAEKERQKTL